MENAPAFTRIEFTRRFDKTYAKLQVSVQKQVRKAITHLFENPAHPGLETHPIRPGKVYWEAYVNRSDRLIYRPEGETLYILDVVAHDDIGKYG